MTNPADATLPPPSDGVRQKDHIFISYSHEDRALVDRLAHDLRQHGYTTWIDFEGIHGGDIWKQAIVDGIFASAVVLVVLSPDSVVSAWVALELRAALAFGKRLIPLLVRKMRNEADQAAYDALNISEIQGIDFAAGYEAGFERLLRDLPAPEVGVAGHCRKIQAQLAARPWGPHYIQSEARLLPIDASPYEDGVVKGQPENLIKRLHASHRLIVLGEPGMGKTVALERLAWELAGGDPRVVPVFISLFEYDGTPLIEWIHLNLRQHGEIHYKNPDETAAFLLDEHQFHHCYFLLDGLNEVQPQHRYKVLAEIRKLAMNFPRHHLVVTSRVKHEDWRQLRQSIMRETYLVQPISDGQARRYLCAHLEIEDGELLWDQLDERMRGLATTPLLLWLIKDEWLEARKKNPNGPIKMPENRGVLYQSFVRRMLRRDRERRLTEKVDEKPRLQALEQLALRMCTQRAFTVSYDLALQWIDDPVILDALQENGLLVLVGDWLWFAPHQTLQEHFAARALQEQVMRKVKAKGIRRLIGRLNRGVLELANDPWWAEIFIQLAGLVDDPNALARTVAEVNPWLAWWCVQEVPTVDKATEEAIRSRSEALVRSPNVRKRLRTAEALARLQTARVIEPLIVLALDNDEATRATAARGLRQFGEAGLQQLISLMTSTLRPERRACAGRSVAELGDSRPGVLAPNGVPDFEWCEVPAGPFMMGGDPDAWYAWAGGEFSLDYTFWIAKYPVTVAQYEPFVTVGGYRERRYWTDAGWQQREADNWPEPGYWDDPQWHIANHPVVGVSWYEAHAYIQWLNEQRIRFPVAPENYVIRLPRECEWEKATRYPDSQLFPWGNEWDPSRLNWGECGIGRTSVVGMFLDGANSAHGACDLVGNVWEWCLTEWSGNYESPDAENNHQEGIGGRVARGGSWGNRGLQYLRAAVRDGVNPTDWSLDLGFRPVVSIPIE